MLSKILDRNNLHHAHLIEGERESNLAQVLQFFDSIGVATTANADLSIITLDTFKIDDARNLKSFALEKSFSAKEGSKKIFIISANTFLLEAQNTLLKVFEEPIPNTYFFVLVPDASIFLKTLFSRFYFISTKEKVAAFEKDAEKFTKMPIQKRLEYVKELLAVDDEEDESTADSPRSKGLNFLNALEASLHSRLRQNKLDSEVFEHIFKVRKALRMPGSAPKTLLESIAVIVPSL